MVLNKKNTVTDSGKFLVRVPWVFRVKNAPFGELFFRFVKLHVFACLWNLYFDYAYQGPFSFRLVEKELKYVFVCAWNLYFDYAYRGTT